MIRLRKEKYWESESRKNISTSEISSKSYFTRDFNVDFDASYFTLDANTLKFVWASKKSGDILNLQSVIVDKYSFLEYIIANIHFDDIPKIETYLTLVQQEKNFRFSEVIRLRYNVTSWKEVYMNIVVGTRYSNNSPEQLYGCIIDLTDQLGSRTNNSFNEAQAGSDDELVLISSLSKREKEVASLIVRGFTDKEIGKELNISYYTADTHRKNIINKLKVKNTACLAYMAGKIGLL